MPRYAIGVEDEPGRANKESSQMGYGDSDIYKNVMERR